ncbi:hypothetical protein [Halalkalicoccus ordinarius]|uniref:hypothetical protein n=1 Tax=Halalkalicoccus ordinarius TaxID=3116651 RepID=UPI00300F311C
MERTSEEVALAIGIGMVVTAAFVWWSDPAGRPFGVPSAYVAAFGIGIGFAIVLRAVRGLVDRE